MSSRLCSLLLLVQVLVWSNSALPVDTQSELDKIRATLEEMKAQKTGTSLGWSYFHLESGNYS